MMSKDKAMQDPKPAKLFRIEDFETLKIIANPLRFQIVECLHSEPLTVKQVAEKLGLSANKLYYHVKQLEMHGFIEVAETRVVSNIIEKVYRAAAAEIEIDPALCTVATDEGKERISSVITTMIDTTREDLVRSLEASDLEREQGGEGQPRRAYLDRSTVRIDKARVQEFRSRLAALMKEFESADVDEASAAEVVYPYTLLIAFYRQLYYPDTDQV
jgi:DNA-binding transcriptional ArsR family regulator